MKSISLVWQILIGLLFGILVGWYFNVNPTHQVWVSTEILKPLGDIFINMMKMVVVPIVLCCMILGIAGGGDNKSFGKMGAGSLLYFFTITSLAIVWGLLLANFFSTWGWNRYIWDGTLNCSTTYRYEQRRSTDYKKYRAGKHCGSTI